MPDTTNRPTPAELATNAWTRDYLYRLVCEHGYFIVHPDDTPPWRDRNDWTEGWNTCRAHIFGDNQ